MLRHRPAALASVVLACAALLACSALPVHAGTCLDPEQCDDPCPAEFSCNSAADCGPGETCLPACLPTLRCPRRAGLHRLCAGMCSGADPSGTRTATAIPNASDNGPNISPTRRRPRRDGLWKPSTIVPERVQREPGHAGKKKRTPRLTPRPPATDTEATALEPGNRQNLPLGQTACRSTPSPAKRPAPRATPATLARHRHRRFGNPASRRTCSSEMSCRLQPSHSTPTLRRGRVCDNCPSIATTRQRRVCGNVDNAARTTRTRPTPTWTAWSTSATTVRAGPPEQLDFRCVTIGDDSAVASSYARR